MSESVAPYPYVTSEGVSTNETCTADRLCKLESTSFATSAALDQQFPNAYAIARAEICPSFFGFPGCLWVSNCPPTDVKSIQFWAVISNDQVFLTPDDEYDERDEVS
jgi:hypothetical protein